MIDVTILVGTVFGGALATAKTVAQTLTKADYAVRIVEEPRIEDLSVDNSILLVCTSTTGQGELPANILPFYLNIRDQLPLQPDRPFGLIVLGDSSYGETFCGAGDQMEEAFLELACEKVGETLRIDASEVANSESLATDWCRAWMDSLPSR